MFVAEPICALVMVVPTTLVHVLPPSMLNSLVVFTPVMAFELALNDAAGMAGRLGTVMLKAADGKLVAVFLILTWVVLHKS